VFYADGPLVKQLIKRANSQDLTLAYTVPAFIAGDVEGFLTGVARSQGRLKKVRSSLSLCDFADPTQHGVPDLDGAGRNILRDWALDNFPYYTLPASSKKDKAAAKVSQTELDSRDAVVLAALKTKAELKREGPRGLIRLKAGSVDDREVSMTWSDLVRTLTPSQLILDEEYGVDQDSDESDDEDAEFDEEELDEDLEDDEDAEEAEDDLEEGSESGEEVIFENDEEPEASEEEEEEEPVVVVAPSKKRKAAPEPAASKKRKVEFNLVPQPPTKTVVPVKASAPKPVAAKASAPVKGNDKKRRRASDQGAAPTTKKAKVGRR
jgi:nuclear GTP-binding protein